MFVFFIDLIKHKIGWLLTKIRRVFFFWIEGEDATTLLVLWPHRAPPATSTRRCRCIPTSHSWITDASCANGGRTARRLDRKPQTWNWKHSTGGWFLLDLVSNSPFIYSTIGFWIFHIFWVTFASTPCRHAEHRARLQMPRTRRLAHLMARPGRVRGTEPLITSQ